MNYRRTLRNLEDLDVISVVKSCDQAHWIKTISCYQLKVIKMRHRNAQRSRSVAVILTNLNEPKDRITVDELTMRRNYRIIVIKKRNHNHWNLVNHKMFIFSLETLKIKFSWLIKGVMCILWLVLVDLALWAGKLIKHT